MLAGISTDGEAALRDQLKLKDPNSFHYLNQSGCVSDPTIDDVEDFDRV